MKRLDSSRWRRTFVLHGKNCWFCGGPANSVDHAVPRSRGGGNHTYNLLPACKKCNSSKDDRTIAEYRKLVRVVVFRRLLKMGIVPTHKIKVVFFGEGNPSPYIIHQMRSKEGIKVYQ